MVLLPEPFQARGYRTGAVTTSGWITPDVNYDQGFDHYRLTGRSDAEVVAAAADFLQEVRSEPFFLYLHLLDLHDYYHWDRLAPPGQELPEDLGPAMQALRGQPPAAIYATLYERPHELGPSDVAWLQAAYDRELRATDRTVGRLLDHLERLGLSDSTVVALTSDHGEQFAEHGALGHGGNAFYNEVLHVPLVLAGALPDDPISTFADAVSTLDLYPTLLGLAGIERPAQVSGRDLRSASSGGPVLATNETTWKLVEGDWSYIYSRRHEREELYDLARDPGELSDLAGARPDVTATMRARLEETIRQGRRHPYAALRAELGRVPMSDRVESTLRSLGYLD